MYQSQIAYKDIPIEKGGNMKHAYHILLKYFLLFWVCFCLSACSTEEPEAAFQENEVFERESKVLIDQKDDAILNEFELANGDLLMTMEQLADFQEVLKQQQFRKLYVSTEKFLDDQQPYAQVIDHGSYYEITHGVIFGAVSYDQTVMDGKGVGDTLELDNAIYRIKEITIWDLGDGEGIDLELVSEEEDLEECYYLSRNFGDGYYTPYYFDSITPGDILYSGSLYFSKDCIINVNDPHNEFKNHQISIDDFFTLGGDEVGAQYGNLSFWGTFETDSLGVIISYWESFLS